MCLLEPEPERGPAGAAQRPQKSSRLLRARSSTPEAWEQEDAERHDITDRRSSRQQKNSSNPQNNHSWSTEAHLDQSRSLHLDTVGP